MCGWETWVWAADEVFFPGVGGSGGKEPPSVAALFMSVRRPGQEVGENHRLCPRRDGTGRMMDDDNG
jgi:hypothetical protein